jgi:hypothetical protein
MWRKRDGVRVVSIGAEWSPTSAGTAADPRSATLRRLAAKVHFSVCAHRTRARWYAITAHSHLYVPLSGCVHTCTDVQWYTITAHSYTGVARTQHTGTLGVSLAQGHCSFARLCLWVSVYTSTCSPFVHWHATRAFVHVYPGIGLYAYPRTLAYKQYICKRAHLGVLYSQWHTTVHLYIGIQQYSCTLCRRTW